MSEKQSQGRVTKLIKEDQGVKEEEEEEKAMRKDEAQ